MVLPKPSRLAPFSEPAPHYYVELDGLRGIAVLAVLGYHFGAPFLTGGYLGVDVFFVISGFVVTRNLTRVLDEPRWVRHFYRRRAARLLPVLACFLLVLVPYWALTGRLDADAGTAVLGSLAMSANVALSFFGAEPDGTSILWSLAVEWHFYLLAPSLLLIARHRLDPVTRALTLVALAGAVAGARLWALTIGDIGAFDVYVASWFRLDGLLLGSAVALVPPLLFRDLQHARVMALGVVGTVVAMMIGPAWGVRAPVTLGFVVPVVSLLVLGVVMSAVGRHADRRARMAAHPAAGNVPVDWTTTTVLPRIAGPSGGLTALALRTPALRWAGERSYSLYLWHYGVGVLVVGRGSEAWQGWPVFVVQVALSLVAADLSYRHVEQPARRALNRGRRPAAHPAAGATPGTAA
ncbi:MAG: acyltransferase [Actinomycetota bacterium]